MGRGCTHAILRAQAVRLPGGAVLTRSASDAGVCGPAYRRRHVSGYLQAGMEQRRALLPDCRTGHRSAHGLGDQVASQQARSTSRSAASRPAACLRSSATDLRLRPTRSNRVSSGRPSPLGSVRSIRSTSAPRSASIIAASGPGPMLANSTTLSPCKGPIGNSSSIGSQPPVCRSAAGAAVAAVAAGSLANDVVPDLRGPELVAAARPGRAFGSGGDQRKRPGVGGREAGRLGAAAAGTAAAGAADGTTAGGGVATDALAGACPCGRSARYPATPATTTAPAPPSPIQRLMLALAAVAGCALPAAGDGGIATGAAAAGATRNVGS